MEVDELCTFLKNEAKNDGFARNFVNFRLVRVRFASGLLIIGIQGRYLISRLEIEDSKPQKNSSQRSVYYQTIPPEKHITGKKFTQGIENLNGRIRHYLSGFARRTKDYFKSEQTINSALHLLFHHHS